LENLPKRKIRKFNGKMFSAEMPITYELLAVGGILDSSLVLLAMI